MKKSYLILVAAAAIFAACSSDSLTTEKQSPQIQDAAEQVIGFDAYLNRGVTRAGDPGTLSTAGDLGGTEKASLKDGFGVFAYYTNGEQYAGTTTPNFMYNEKVWYDDPNWTYSPVKYWPNEFGSDAISDQVDRVSFFAYAPYVDVTPQTGIVTLDKTENITAVTRNNATGDPFVKYTATMDPANSVDLCYGVSAENFTSSNSTVFPNDIAAGDPFVDVAKPGLGAKLKFNFKHALSSLNVQIDAVVNDLTENAPTSNLQDQTKIWVRSVTFEGITLKGQLNLRDHKWYAVDASGDNEIASGSVTVYDGRKDGKEPVGAATNETPSALNPAIIQSLPYDKTAAQTSDILQTTNSSDVTGVTETAQNLFNSTTKTDPIFVIPTGETMKVTIVYDVETYDPKLAQYLSDGVTPGSTIQNTITKTVDAFGQLQAGLSYILKLHLGLRSVEFDALVEPWAASIEDDTDLPSNAPMLATADPYTQGSTVVPASATSYVFTVTGLNPLEAISKTNGESLNVDDLVTSVTSDPTSAADANGKAKITANFSENKTVHKKTGWAQVVGNDSGKGAKVTITQGAHALGLGFADASTTGKTITVTTSGDLDASEPFKTNLTGATITVVDMADAGATNLYSAVSGLVITTSALESGHTYKVTVTAGDVTESFIKQIP